MKINNRASIWATVRHRRFLLECIQSPPWPGEPCPPTELPECQSDRQPTLPIDRELHCSYLARASLGSSSPPSLRMNYPLTWVFVWVKTFIVKLSYLLLESIPGLAHIYGDLYLFGSSIAALIGRTWQVSRKRLNGHRNGKMGLQGRVRGVISHEELPDRRVYKLEDVSRGGNGKMIGLSGNPYK